MSTESDMGSAENRLLLRRVPTNDLAVRGPSPAVTSKSPRFARDVDQSDERESENGAYKQIVIYQAGITVPVKTNPNIYVCYHNRIH